MRSLAFPWFAVALLATACAPSSDNSAPDENFAQLQDKTSAEPTTLVGRTEAALLDQISCRKPPEAAVAVSAMLKNGLSRETSDGADGSPVFVPLKPLHLLGFPLVRITGWQANDDGVMKPFYRGPGTAPPNFISVVVDAKTAEVRAAIRRYGMREGRYLGAPSQGSLPGIDIDDGDFEGVESPKEGVTTLTCTANEYDFEQ